MVEVDPSTMEPTITLPDGKITHSYDEYQQAIYSIHEADPNATFAIEFGDQFSKMIGIDLGEVAIAAGISSAVAYAISSVAAPLVLVFVGI